MVTSTMVQGLSLLGITIQRNFRFVVSPQKNLHSPSISIGSSYKQYISHMRGYPPGNYRPQNSTLNPKPRGACREAPMSRLLAQRSPSSQRMQTKRGVSQKGVPFNEGIPKRDPAFFDQHARARVRVSVCAGALNSVLASVTSLTAIHLLSKGHFQHQGLWKFLMSLLMCTGTSKSAQMMRASRKGPGYLRNLHDMILSPNRGTPKL